MAKSGYKSLSPVPGFIIAKNRVLIAVFAVAVIVIGVCSVATLNRRKQERNSKVVVDLTSGKVSGTEEIIIIDNVERTGYKFSGIPYAEPPVGERRWTAPVFKKKWHGVLKADTSKIRCIQFGSMHTNVSRKPSEDCLYLHVHTPTLNRSANLPVLVWLHGGFSMYGYSDVYGYSSDTELALYMNVVAVNVNFRLNALGYLTLKELWQENVSYGNYGLMDQTLALKWIQENIKGFGGNPGSVTILGQSSGGTSILALLASPPADGLFHKVISMSGSPYFPKTYEEATKNHRMFINNSKCADIPESSLKECLYQLTPPEILKAIPQNWKMADFNDFPTYDLIDDLVFVLDPVVLPKSPKDIADIPNMKTNVSVMIGSTAQEIGFDPVQHFDTGDEFTKYLEQRLKPLSVNFSAMDAESAYDGSEQHAQVLYETIATDVRVTCYSNFLLTQLRRSARLKNTYRFIASYRMKTPVTISGGSLSPHNSFHAIDSFAFFGMKIYDNYVPNEQDKRFTNTLRSIVKSFMVDGTVEAVDPGDTIIFSKDGNVAAQSAEYHVKQCNEFWNDKKFRPYVWVN